MGDGLSPLPLQKRGTVSRRPWSTPGPGSGRTRALRRCSSPGAVATISAMSLRRQRARAAPSRTVQATADGSSWDVSGVARACWDRAADLGGHPAGRGDPPRPRRPRAAPGMAVGQAADRAGPATCPGEPAVARGQVRSATFPAMTSERPPARWRAPGGRTQPVAGLSRGAGSKVGRRAAIARARSAMAEASAPPLIATHTCRPPVGPERVTTCRIWASASQARSWARSSSTGPPAASRSKASRWNRPIRSARYSAHGRSGSAGSAPTCPGMRSAPSRRRRRRRRGPAAEASSPGQRPRPPRVHRGSDSGRSGRRRHVVAMSTNRE